MENNEFMEDKKYHHFSFYSEPMTEEDELGDEHLWRKHGFTGLDHAENLPPPPPPGNL